MWLRLILAFAVVTSCCVDASTTKFTNETRSSLRILSIFGYMGKSHFAVFKPLLLELARRGHNVTVVSFFPRTEADKVQEPLPNYRDVNLLSRKDTATVNVIDLTYFEYWIVPTVAKSLLGNIQLLWILAKEACETGLKNPDLQKLLRSNETFDLIITEAFNTDCYLVFVDKFKAPFIFLSSHEVMPWRTEQFGHPDEPSHMPMILYGMDRPLSFLDRVCNTVGIYSSKILYWLWFVLYDVRMVRDALGSESPDLQEIARNVSAVLVNTHYTLHGTRSHLPNTIEIGGLHIPPKVSPLPKDIAKFLDDAHEGVLYFNLGSMIKASSLPKQKLTVILNAIGSIPRKVIWKWEDEELPNKPKNVLIRKWLPQFDILNHPNVKAYMGHGGLLGLSEGIYTGVPMILIPMYGDQFYNAAAAKNRGAAIVLDFRVLDVKTIRNALDEIFNNTMYRENVQKLSRAYRDRPMSPLETAVWWTEYIGRGNALSYVQSEAARLPWYQRYLIDVILFLMASALLSIYLVHRLIKYLFKGRFGDSKEKKSKKTD